MNSGKPRLKRSSLERSANSGTVLFFIFEFVILFFSALFNYLWNRGNPVMVPISLYVTLEFVKVFLARLVEQDLALYHEETNTPCKARTSTLLEQLGQLDYIFSDKTGTLTKNEMEFMKCSIGGISYGTGITDVVRSTMVRHGQVPPPPSQPLPGMPDDFRFNDLTLLDFLVADNGKLGRRFFTAMALCHTVYPKDDGDEIKFEASSPDELALVTAADNIGFKFLHRTATAAVVEIQGEERAYEVLNILEFSSDRKRMSVITRDYKGRIVLWCKGADSVILPRLRSGQTELIATTKEHLDQYAEGGLRTLLFARRPLSKAVYNHWARRYQEAVLAMVDREQRVAEVAEEIEQNLVLLGATGIEDKLQDGVPETIDKLSRAGLKIWMLTGDKQETAINIGFACALLKTEMKQYVINTTDVKATQEALTSILIDMDNNPQNKALIIDGAALHAALSDELYVDFLRVAVQMSSVICCRVSPSQKAEVCLGVKEATGAMCLAIGDGANDVTMIQAADVGVGITGHEGSQAAMASDYSFGQFRFLERLLLVHGRWSYKRMSMIIVWSFYKNLLFVLNNMWFSLFNGFSSQTLYDPWSILLFNTIFTSPPIFAYGLFERDLSARMLLQFPQLYRETQLGQPFGRRVFLSWMIAAVFQSCSAFFLTVFCLVDLTGRKDGQQFGHWATGTTVFLVAVHVVNAQLAIETRTWTWLNLLTYGGCTLFYWVWLLGFFTDSLVDKVVGDSSMYAVGFKLGVEPSWWLTILLAVATCIGPPIVMKTFRRHLMARPFEVVQELEHLEPGDIDAAMANVAVAFRRRARVMQTSVFEVTRKVRQLVLFRDRQREPGSEESSSGLSAEVVDGAELEFSGYAFDQDEGRRPLETIVGGAVQAPLRRSGQTSASGRRTTDSQHRRALSDLSAKWHETRNEDD